MSDEKTRPSSATGQTAVGDVVSQVTVKALQEFDTGDMPEDTRAGETGTTSPTKPASRPSSGKGSRPTSAASKPSSRPPSASKDRTPSRTGSRASVDRPGSVKGSPPVGSPAGSRPTSARKTSRPSSSAAQNAANDDFMVQGSRPSSREQGGVAQSPASGRSTPGRPGSAARTGSRAGSVRSTSGRPPSGRPESARSTKTPTPDRVPYTSGNNQTEGQWADDDGRTDTHQADEMNSPHTPPQTREDEPPAGMTNLMDSFGGPDGGDGGGSDESDDGGEEEELEGDEDDEIEDSDEETEMVVLDPDHPLMQRFQKALKSHLDKQNEKVTLELQELLEGTKNKKKEREDLGVELYGVQQELARHQMMLEQLHDDYSQITQVRNQLNQQLNDVQEQYNNKQLNMNEQKKRGGELQAEVENLSLRLFYVENAKEDVRSDIAVMKRAAEKAEAEVARSELEKQKQDLFVDRLVDRVDKLQEEIAMYEAQQTAQRDETQTTRNALSEAHMEIEAINVEKKQLFQQWNSSLIGMRRRDEAHSAMQEALDQQQQRIMSLETEIDGYKKSIQKEQEQNEKLCLVLGKTDADIATVRKMLTICQAKHDALKNEYATYTRMLHETEQALNRANADKTLKSNELNGLRKQIEREYLAKVKLEDEILEELRGQLTMDKAAQYTDKLTNKMRHLTKSLESQIAVVENDTSKETLELSNVQTRIENLRKVARELDEEIREKNEVISKSESDMVKRNAVIERKQGVIDQSNKKFELLKSQAGGVEIGPLEIQINSLQKSLGGGEEEITEMQQMWLRSQSELVQLTKEKEKQFTDVGNYKKQLTILSQKKLRIENDINQQLSETAGIERNIGNMQNDMLKLNMLLHKERGLEHELEQHNILMEGDFSSGLKEAEREAIAMQDRLEGLCEEKERLLNSLVEAERQIMLWEKKTQLARETRAAVDGEIGQGEVKAMRAEIHRMQVRHAQLMKQQERMIQDMEKAVSRRDTIVTRGDAQSKINKKTLTKGTFQRQMAELKKKIKQTIQDASSCDGQIRDLRDHQQSVSSQLEEKQLTVQQLQSHTDTLDGDVDRLLEQKQKNMTDLLTKQQRSKYYQQLKDGKYSRLCKTNAALDIELQKHVDRMQAVIAIIDRLHQEYPHVQPGLRKVSLAYGSRAVTGDEY